MSSDREDSKDTGNALLAQAGLKELINFETAR